MGKVTNNKIGKIELSYWDENNNSIEVYRISTCCKYREKGYATKMIERLIECAQFYGVKEITLTACAERCISQSELEMFYQKRGFKKINENSRKMKYVLK